LLPYKTVRDIASAELRGKVVYMRVDFNVPLTEQGEISSDTRISSALPTIQYLIERGAKVVLATHFGRPEKEEDFVTYSTKKIAKRLSELLGKDVGFVADSKGPELREAVKNMKEGDIRMLENVRFYGEETSKDPEVVREHAQEMAESIGADVFVFDGPAAAHRGSQASIGPVSEFISGAKVIGFLAEKELSVLNQILEGPALPTVLIVGGKKIKSKLEAVKGLAETRRVDLVIFDGAIANVVLKAKGYEVGASYLGKNKEEGKLNENLAKEVLEILEIQGIEYVLPVDFRLKSGELVKLGEIPKNGVIADIGPISRENAIEALWDTAVLGPDLTRVRIIRSGTAGIINYDQENQTESFPEGTNAIIEALAEHPTARENKLILGGDGEDAARAFFAESNRNPEEYFFILTSGGAALTFLAGKSLTALEYIDKP
jgi:phosphoglycerate kinase